MNLQQVLGYDSGFVFRHKLTNKIFTKFTVKTLIAKYAKRVSNAYCKSSITREMEKMWTGDIIRQEKRGLYHTSENKPKDFEDRFTALLVPIPKYVARLDENDQEKMHESSCEFARDDDCHCWCEGKYHGIGVVF